MPRFLAFFFCGTILLAGCNAGPEYIPVKGKVTYDGVPIESGLVRFDAVDGKSPSAKGGTIIKGEYAAEAPAGEFLVRITGTRVTGKRKMYDTPDSPMVDKTEEVVPKNYNTESTLKVTIQVKKDDLDFKLEK
jgi:hypothetical protein